MNINSKVCETTTKNVSTLIDKYLTLWNEKNADCFADLFSENAEFTGVNKKTFIKRKSIEEYHQNLFNNIFRKSVLKLNGIYARGLSDDLVIITANWQREHNLDEAGNTARDRNGILQLIVNKNTTEGYKIILAHLTDTTNTSVSETISNMIA